MDLFDRLALIGRKYQPRHSAITGGTELRLDEVLRVFHGKTILEMEVRPAGKDPRRYMHERGRPVSLVDGISEISTGNGADYHVHETAPSGDFVKVRIQAQPAGGQLSMLVGRRTTDHVPAEDALFDHLERRQSGA